jgi:hypothetical protein
LNPVERNRKDDINRELEAILKMEEIKVQHPEIGLLKKNTAYFMVVANQRNRKKG